MDISNNDQGLYDLPDSWEWVTIGEITEINPKLPESNYSDNLEVSFIPMKAVEAKTGIFDLSEIKKFSEVKKGYTAFTDEDIILAKITPCLENGKIAILKNLKNKIGFGSTEFHVIRVINNLIFHKYIYFFCQNSDFIKDARKNMTGSAGQLRVSSNYLKATLIPLPPLNEQKRIVEKIEELFTKLDAGIELLRKLQVKLKRYRQSVLKSAFEGKLTEEWRQANQANLEPAEILLERMKENSTHNKQKSDNRKLLDPFKIIENWQWVTLFDICTSITDGDHQAPPKTKEGVPFLVISNINKGSLDFSNTRYVPEDYYQKIQEHRKPQKGDIIYSVVGSYGIPVLIETETRFCFQRHIALLKIHPLMNNRYLLYALKSDFVYNQATDAATGTAQLTVSLTELRKIKIPLASIEEQNKIVEEIDRIFSVTDQLEKIIERNIKRAEKLRQSILKQAFTGKLVPQDINDEPASKLLEKIKQEKAKLEPKKKTTKRSKGNS